MKLLIVGAGSIGKRHARNACAHAEAAVVDVDLQTARSCSEELGIRYFTNLESGLAWGPDGVIIATPTDHHIKTASKVSKYVKHILIEKPISHSVKEAQTFLKDISHSDRKVYVVCNMRFHAGIRTLRDNLPRVGKPLYARSHYGNYLPSMRPDRDYRELYCAKRSRGGGVVMDCIHELDYLISFFGSVKKVMYYTDKLSDLEIDVEDFASICLKHIDGTVAELQLDYLRPAKRRGCEVVGDQGMLLWNSEGKSPEECTVSVYSNAEKQWITLYKNLDYNQNEPYNRLVKEFVAAINGEQSVILSGADATAELELIENMLKR